MEKENCIVFQTNTEDVEWEQESIWLTPTRTREFLREAQRRNPKNTYIIMTRLEE